MERPWNKPVEMASQGPAGSKVFKNYVPLGFRLVGLRLYTPECCTREQERYVHCMQKSLFGSKDWFYFCKGFRIFELEGDGFRAEIDANAFDANFCIYRGTRELIKQAPDKGKGKSRLDNLSVNAIVGQNGTGKSTIVDMIIRIINNLSAAIYGENFIYNGAQHLHYIENVYASLAVYIDDHLEILTVKGHDIYMDTLRHVEADFDNKSTPLFYNYSQSSLRKVILNSKDHDAKTVLEGNEGFRLLLNDWFYTIVSNYSLYAYNFNDYELEQTFPEKIEQLRPQMDDVPEKEDYFWLKGVFHKNDGYQTPLVVNPMRQNGYINAEKENTLGKQNLIMLAFQKVEYIDSMGQREYSDFTYRNINDTHRVVSLYHTWPDKDKYEGFSNTYLDGKQLHEPEIQKQYDSLNKTYKYVKEYWEKRLGLCCVKECIGKLVKTGYVKVQAWDYVVYKTFRTLEHYKKYKNDYEFFTDSFDPNSIEEHLDKLVRDSTHCTRKLRRTLAFIKYFNSHPSTRLSRVDVDDYYEWMQKHLGEPLYTGDFKDYHTIEIEDLLPPPCCQVQLGLVELDCIDDYKRSKDSYLDIVNFEGLSSGERQIAYTIGNLLYHAINIDSTVVDFNASDENREIRHYRHLNVLMDEVELYFHPDLQRRFVKLLVDALNNSTWSSLSSVNITLITHSPFVLSDIPNSNILCLSRKGKVDAFDRTFAANIHDLLNNTFIMPDTIGELAKNHITDFVGIYNQQIQWWRQQDEEGIERSVDNTVYDQYVLNRSRFEYVSGIVGDDYLREELSDMMNELNTFYFGQGLLI